MACIIQNSISDSMGGSVGPYEVPGESFWQKTDVFYISLIREVQVGGQRNKSAKFEIARWRLPVAAVIVLDGVAVVNVVHVTYSCRCRSGCFVFV